ncbi:MAG: MFS transporter [Pseudomonadota bacterium]
MKLPAYGLFAAMLAAAGLPIYLHAPAYYAAKFGIGLTALSGVLFFLRLLDVVQDPFFGWLSGRLIRRRTLSVSLAIVALAVSMLGLFAVEPPVAPLLWFAAMLTVLFSAYSFLTISFYARGVSKASGLGAGGHLRLAAWRETGALVGVCAAAVAPTLLAGTGAGYTNFALGFMALCLLAWLVMRPEWSTPDEGASAKLSDFFTILRDPNARRILLIGLANAAPVAVSSSLFLFFVQDVLAAPDWAGPLLVIFFLAAALGAVVWPRLSRSVGTRRALSIAMAVNIAAFAPVAFLGAGDGGIFAVICVISGFAIGADFTLVPAIFARRMEVIAPTGTAGFGLWAFVTKLSLALAAILLLPALEHAGYVAGGDSPAAALSLLAVLYAGLPCVLKLAALALLWAGPIEAD